MSGNASTFSNNLTSNMSRTNSWNARFRLEWTPDSLTNIMMRPQFNYNSNDGLGEGYSMTFDEDPFKTIKDPFDDEELQKLIDKGVVKNRNVNNSISYSDSKSAGGWLQLNRRLNSKGRNITLVRTLPIRPTVMLLHRPRTGTTGSAPPIANPFSVRFICSSAISISIAIPRATAPPMISAILLPTSSV